MYKDMWAAATGEVLVCRREPTNAADRYTVAERRDSCWTLTADLEGVLPVPKRRLDMLYSDWE